MDDDEQTQEELDKLKDEPLNNMPDGLEVFEPKDDAIVKNINQQDDKQFVAKDINYSQNTADQKNERYTGPVTQAHYETNETSQSYNSANTDVHKSHATRNKKLALIALFLLIAIILSAGYLMSS